MQQAPAGSAHVMLVSLDSQDAILAIPLVAPGCRLHVSRESSAFLGILPRLTVPLAQ